MKTSTTTSDSTCTSTSTTASKRSSSKSSSKKDGGNTLLVAMMDQTVRDCGPKEIYTPVSLRCPHTGHQHRDYLLLTTTTTVANKQQQHHLLEIQCLQENTSGPKSYNSWFVGNRIVSNGKLYVTTRVDPLFWVLPANGIGDMNSQWQPMNQLLPNCPTIQKVLDPLQLQHIFDEYEIDNDEKFYKFSCSKTLQWLTKKQQSVYQVLLQQFLAAQVRQDKMMNETEGGGNGGGGGAFAKDFCLASDETQAKPAAKTTDNNKKDDDCVAAAMIPTEEMKTQAQRESIQIICNYLSSDWRTAFLKHMETDVTVLQEPEKANSAKRAKQDLMATPSSANHNTSATVTPESITATKEEKKKKAAPAAPKLTLGQKQLLKVNKKGMKSMTAFFAPVKKKKT